MDTGQFADDPALRIWKSRAGTKYCTLGGLRGVDRPQEIKRGSSRADGFPDGAFFEMDKKFPKQVALADSVSNMDGMVVVSKPLKDFLATKAFAGVEILPVSIHDHKGRVASSEYFIINPTVILDCIDKSQSQISWNPMDPALICGCLAMVLDAGATGSDVALLRPKHLELIVLIREALASEIDDLGFTGTNFVEVDEFQY